MTSGSLVGSDRLSGTLLRSAGENVGSYVIDASGLANGNYLITAQNGTLTIGESPAYNAAVASLRGQTAATAGSFGAMRPANAGPASDADPRVASASSAGRSTGGAQTRGFSRLLVLRGGINLGVQTPAVDEMTEISR